MNVSGEINTARTRLRRLEPRDLPGLIELESDPDVVRFTRLRTPLGPMEIEKRLRSQIERQAQWEPLGIWAAESRANQQFVGWFMILPVEGQPAELGFMVPKRLWGQGYSSECAAALVEHAFRQLTLPALSAVTDSDNSPSIRVLEKLGFQRVRAEANAIHWELRAT